MDTESRGKYTALAVEAKAEYEKALAEYTPDPTLPPPPLKPKSAFYYFGEATRMELQLAQPDMIFSQLSALIAEEWKNLSDNDRETFEEQAEEDKARFRAEMAAVRRGAAREKNRHQRGLPCG